jgi:alanine-glyoxylate transaminase/serine-glyoxylate transaminase/serine-pyruvate transaminase
VLSPGDQVVMYETGHFASLWNKMATRLGVQTEFLALPGPEHGVPASWRRGVQADLIEAAPDSRHPAPDQGRVRGAQRNLDRRHQQHRRRAPRHRRCEAPGAADGRHHLRPGLRAEYKHDEWGVDVSVSGSQKGLMLPPGISFNALSPKAIEASKTAKLPKAFWAWDEIIEMNQGGYWPYTPNTNLLYGLSGSLRHAAGPGPAGWTPVFARHQRWGEGVRAAVRAWGLEIQCADPAVYSPVLTGVIMPEGVDADAVRKLIYERFDCSLGTGLGKVKGRMFRIGHLGDCNDLTLMAALSGCEMGLKLAGVKLAGSGVLAAMEYFAGQPMAAPSQPVPVIR